MAHVSFHQTDLKEHALVEVCVHMKEREQKIVNVETARCGRECTRTRFDLLDVRVSTTVCVCAHTLICKDSDSCWWR